MLRALAVLALAQLLQPGQVRNGFIQPAPVAFSTLQTPIPNQVTGAAAMVGNATAPWTDARASTATDVIGGVLYTWPQNVIPIDTNGALVEPASTNLVEYSAALSTSPWTATNTTVTVGQAGAPDGTSTAATLQSTSAGGYIEQPAVASASASLYAASFWTWTASGTQATALQIYDATNSTALATCTPTATTSSTAVQQCCALTANATAGHALQWRFYPGGTAGTGTVSGFGAQLEAQPSCTSYIATAGTTATRAGDVLTFIPTTNGYNNFCLGVTLTPDGWNAGTAWSANSFYFLPGSGAVLYGDNSSVYSYDGIGSLSVTPGFASGTPFRLTLGTQQGIGRSFSVNGGTPVTGTASAGGSLDQLNGVQAGAPFWLSNLKIGTTSDWRQCQ